MSATLRGIALLASLMLCACVDLAEPNIPSLGAPAIFNITLRQIPGTPFDVSGTLSAGREVSGVRRRVLTPLIVLGQPFNVGEPNAQGIYVLSPKPLSPPAGFVGPFDVQGPIIDGLAEPTQFRWYGIRRLDPDVVRPDSIGDVTLHIESDAGPAVPANRTRQWFLDLRGDFGSIRVSGDGAPPAVLRIPSQFIPPAPDKQVDISLIYFQSATVVPPPGNYISSVTLDVRVGWILRLP